MAGTCLPSPVAIAKRDQTPSEARSEGRRLARAPSVPLLLSCVQRRTRARSLPGATLSNALTSRDAADESDSPDASIPPPRWLAGLCPHNSGTPRAPQTRGHLEAPGAPRREEYLPVLPGTRKLRDAWHTRRRWLH